MTPVTFKGYGIGASSVTIVVERITHWTRIDYNGRSGMEIYLDTGVSVRVEEYEFDIQRAIAEARKAAA